MQASPEDTLFVFARPTLGSRMPVALLRKKVRDLPLEFRLDDSMAMSEAAKLSGSPRVIVTARITKSGMAKAQSGDWQVVSKPVALGATGIALEINEAIP